MQGIYIHIPFCKQACNYCNFHFTTSLRKKNDLVAALKKEIALVKHTEKVQTIYLGGGTPSLLTVEEMAALLSEIKKNFEVTEHAEITVEANPDDISQTTLQAWSALGINRLSVGIQSFFEEDLVWMNRAHNAQQALAALELCTAYFDNFTIDLIYGIPGLTNERWKANVEKAIAAGVKHLSCYALTVEPKTPLDKLIRTHKKTDTDAGQQSAQFLLLMDWMAAAGYEHYEISNFAKPGYRSRHNAAYWQGKHYTGIGPAAHSYNGDSRFWNVANNQQYIDAVTAGTLPRETELLTHTQKMNEYIMTSLRTMEGMDMYVLGKGFLNTAASKLKQWEAAKWIYIKDNHIILTNEGKLFADGIASDLFLE